MSWGRNWRKKGNWSNTSFGTATVRKEWFKKWALWFFKESIESSHLDGVTISKKWVGNESIWDGNELVWTANLTRRITWASGGTLSRGKRIGIRADAVRRKHVLFMARITVVCVFPAATSRHIY
jgi:hypothetical protein